MRITLTRASSLVAATFPVVIVVGWGCAASPKPDSTADSRRGAPTAVPSPEKRRSAPVVERAAPRNQPARPAEDPLVARMRALAKRSCGCQDMACIGAASKALLPLIKQMQTNPPPKATEVELRKLMVRAIRCTSSKIKSLHRASAGPALDPADPMVKRAKALTKASCACQDRRCAKSLRRDVFRFYLSTRGKARGRRTKMLIAKLHFRAIRCLSKVLAATRP